MRVLITGTAGFIGFHVAQRLLAGGNSVVGIDGFTPYYDVTLKRRRHQLLTEFSKFAGRELQLEQAGQLSDCIKEASADVVIHLAAQAGVRYSYEMPQAYIDSNIVGTFNLIEGLKQSPCRHLIVASTSSVYGASEKQPFGEDQATDRPLSLYAATKIATESLVASHAHCFRLPTTVARLFTVYGPWGRPDMAIFKFTKNIIERQPIDVYGFGKMTRDFTFVDDVVDAILRLAALPPGADAPSMHLPQPAAPYRVVNIGCGQPIGLEEFIATVESEVGHKAIRHELPMQPGDVPVTWADTTRLKQLIGISPNIPVAQGVRAFVAWYREYYSI